MDMYYVYILECADTPLFKMTGQGSRRYYVGRSEDVFRRLREHNTGKCCSTAFGAWMLKAYCVVDTSVWATRIEKWLKSGDTRRKREQLIAAFTQKIDPAALGNALIARVENDQAWRGAYKGRVGE